MDLHENPEKNLVTATFELPGLSKDNVNIDVQDGNLAVSGEASQTSSQQEQGYTIKERKFGRFTRSIKLPEGTNVSDQFPFASESFGWELVLTGFFCAFAAQGRQGVDGKRYFDRHLSQVISWPGAPAYRYQVNEV